MVSTSDIRSRIATAGIAGGWNQTRGAFELFPQIDSKQIVHKGFSVGVTATQVHPPDRQYRTIGALAYTDVQIKCAYLLRGDNQVADYDSGLDAIEELLRYILANYNKDHLILILNSIRRSVEFDR